MKLFVTTEQRFIETANGRVFVNGIENYEFFSRYKDVFDKITVIARKSECKKSSISTQADGPGIKFLMLPNFIGIKSIPSLVPKIIATYKKIDFDDKSYVILRSPGIIADLTWMFLLANKNKFSVEVVSDPKDMYSDRSLGIKQFGILQKLGVYNLRTQCKQAITSAYVTQKILQKSYPPNNSSTFAYSSLDLPEIIYNYYPLVRKKIDDSQEILKTCNLVFVGTLNKPYKGADALFPILQELKNKKRKVHLKIVGSGHLENKFKNEAKQKRLTSLITFTNQLPPGKPVYDEIKKADIMILPSRQEGLPRVLIEAMTIGVPCIANDIGGVSEILHHNDLIQLNNPNQFSNRIIQYMENKSLRKLNSKRNYSISHKFKPKRLRSIRIQHYRAIVNGGVKNL